MQAGTTGVRRREGCAMSQQLGAWLRARRRDRGWDVLEMARQLARRQAVTVTRFPGWIA